MLKINQNYLHLEKSYLFSTIARKVSEFKALHPECDIIKMGIGDVTQPLCPAVIDGMKQGTADMSAAETFKGYGPEQGYDFLHDGVRNYYETQMGVSLLNDEIFISDGAKSDLGNILDIFSRDNTVLIPDPVYPVYVDTNVMDGRKIIYMNASAQNGFLPLPDESVDADIIYLCSPNNPTGAVYDREGLKKWVNYAISHKAVILFDAAYESFIVEKDLPRSIFEIEGARKCAIEFCSLSKKAGFTGVRCGYTVVPHELVFDGTQLNALWLRRQTTKFNGVSYVVQRAAAGVFTPQGEKQTKAVLDYYRRNAEIMSKTLDELGIYYTGGKNSPYVWLKCPGNMASWDFFDMLLEKANVVGTPGQGFGKNGEGFFRLTAFGSFENTKEGMERFKKVF